MRLIKQIKSAPISSDVPSFRSEKSLKLEAMANKQKQDVENLGDDSKQILQFLMDTDRYYALVGTDEDLENGQKNIPGLIEYTKIKIEQQYEKLSRLITEFNELNNISYTLNLIASNACIEQSNAVEYVAFKIDNSKSNNVEDIKALTRKLLIWGRYVTDANKNLTVFVEQLQTFEKELEVLEERINGYPQDMSFSDAKKKPKRKNKSTKTKKTKKTSGKKKLKIVVDTEQ
jgi:hypothetical protein